MVKSTGYAPSTRMVWRCPVRDFTGKSLEVGDKIVFLSHSRNSSELLNGTVMGFTPCFVVTDWLDYNDRGVKVSPLKVVKVAE